MVDWEKRSMTLRASRRMVEALDRIVVDAEKAHQEQEHAEERELNVRFKRLYAQFVDLVSSLKME